MKVLVTGGAGYIGSHVCKSLALSGFEPITFDNLATGHVEAVKWGPLEVGDLSDVAAVAGVMMRHRPDFVIHLAASAYVGESVENPRKYFENNVRNTMNLLGAMLDQGVHRIVFSSSCATYGVPTSMPITEATQQSPINPYGETKLMVERLIEWYAKAYPLRYVTLRYFNAAGADLACEIGENHDPETHLIPLILDAALGRRSSVSVFGTDYPTSDGTAVRDYVHVTDLATAHVAAVRHLVSRGENLACNLGTGQGHSVRDLIRCVEGVTGLHVPLVEAVRRPGDPPVLVADPTLARQVLDWTPQYSELESIVASAYRWQTRSREVKTQN